MKVIYFSLSIVFFIPLFTGCSTENGSIPGDSGPNIVLFVSDDHGTDALGCYGNPVIETPHIDFLADRGVRFTNAFCTSASCAASRSVILTGKYGHATGSYGHVHDYHHFSTFDTVKSLPVFLQEAGYVTARVGKYHLAPESVYHFDEIVEADPRNTVEMANNCSHILSSETPFFLYFCPDDPHRGSPFTPEQWFEPNSFGNKSGGYEGVYAMKYSADSVIVPPFLPDSEECRRELAEYYQSVSRMDQGLGRMIKLLDESGNLDNTIIIYISDNGIAFPGAKTTLYDPGMRLPCVIRDPFCEHSGIVNNAMITWADLTPTILDMAGIDFIANDFHGRSFYDVLGEEEPPGWDEVYASHTFHEITMYYPMRVVRNRNYKLIWNIAGCIEYPFASDLWASSTWQGIVRRDSKYYGKRLVEDYLNRPEFELYDLKADPDEIDNLVFEAGYQDVLESMKEQLRAFQRNTSDPWYILWDHDTFLQGTGVNL